MLTWAREQSLAMTRDAQQRARVSDKIETANKALDCIDSALRLYPDEAELNESKAAIREFMASVKVAHWVELAERSAFKGHNRRAIERYQDALFYLNDENVKSEVRRAGVEKIEREICRLRAGLRRQARPSLILKEMRNQDDMQKLPVGSSRIRRGYKRTPL
jgi:hypothetical protein